MSLLNARLRSRCAPMGRQQRAIRPVLDGLETRELLSALYLRGSSSGYATAWQQPPSGSTVNLGSVADITWLAPADNVGDVLVATVNWGDGTPTTTYNAGIFRYPYGFNSVVVPQHMFQQSGSLRAQILVTDQHGGRCAWTDTFTVADAPMSLTTDEATPVGIASNVVGAQVRFDTMLVSTDPTAVIDKVTYTFTEPDGTAGGILVRSSDVNGNLLPIADQTGFHVEQVRSDFGTVDSITHQHFEGYWDATPGTHHVSTYVNWHNAKGIAYGYQLPTKDYKITAPTASVQTAFGNTSSQLALTPTPDEPNKLGWFLASYQPGQVGISIDATLSGVSSAGGTYGLVQTVNPTSYYWDLTGQKYQAYVSQDPQGKAPPDWPLLDNDSMNPDSPYYDVVGIGQYQTTWNANDALHLSDSPRVQISSLDTKIQENDSFQDFVMFTPTGGIPVPIAMNLNWNQSTQYSFTWSWGGTMTWDVLAISPNPYGLQDPSLSWVSYAVPTTPSWGNTAWYYQQNMPDGIAIT